MEMFGGLHIAQSLCGYPTRWYDFLARLRAADAEHESWITLCQEDAIATRIDELAAERDALAERYAKLKEYVMHRHGCDMLWSDGGRPCTCGLAALLKELR